MINKPKKLWNNFEEFLNTFSFLSKGVYKCYICDGAGRVKDRSQYDVVEGLKHADYIPCDTCCGSKTMSIDFIKSLYRKKVESHRTLIKKYNEDMKLYKSIKRKLTKEEWNFLYANSGNIPKIT